MAALIAAFLAAAAVGLTIASGTPGDNDYKADEF